MILAEKNGANDRLLDGNSNISARKIFLDLWAYLKDSLGFKRSIHSYTLFSLEDVKIYHRYRSGDKANALDEQTISDLDVVHYSKKFFPDISIFGRQSLYDRLKS